MNLLKPDKVEIIEFKVQGFNWFKGSRFKGSRFKVQLVQLVQGFKVQDADVTQQHQNWNRFVITEGEFYIRYSTTPNQQLNEQRRNIQKKKKRTREGEICYRMGLL